MRSCIPRVSQRRFVSPSTKLPIISNFQSQISPNIPQGIHARERGGPDGLLFFIGDLLYANANNVGLKFGAKTYTAAQVKRALATGIVFVPLSNPDGVAYDQTSNSCWRKNRRPGTSVGVDLNRNFDFAWDPSKWAPSVRNSVASSSPSSEVYRGMLGQAFHFFPFPSYHYKREWYIDVQRDINRNGRIF